jgi:hypothetical protein
MIEIIIPTLGRCDNQITLESIPDSYKKQVTLVVQEQEYDYMKEKYGDTCSVWKLPAGTKGIAWTRKHISEHWKGKKVFIMDDDLKFVKLDADLKGKPPTDEQFAEMIDQVERFMNDGYVHGSLGTHNTPPSPKPYSFNSRMYTNVFYSHEFDPSEIDWGTDYELMPEDFYVNLQLLTTGFKNVVFNHFRVNPSATNAKGGCETFRTIENHNRGQEILGEKFPQFVEVYEKEQTSGPWAGKKKKALKIKWKKAYESSKVNALDGFF